MSQDNYPTLPLKGLPLDIRKIILRVQSEFKGQRGIKQFSLPLTIYSIIREWKSMKPDFTLNGYYDEDFKSKQAKIKNLLLEQKVDYNDLNLVMNGELIKFCQLNSDGSYFWLCWGVDNEDSWLDKLSA